MSEARDFRPAHPAQLAVAAAREAIGQLLQANLWSLSEQELLGLRIELETVRAQLDAATLTTTREVDARGAAVATGAASTAAWLRGRLLQHPGAAKAEVALANALDGDQAATGAALARGEVSRAQAETIVAGIRALPTGVDHQTRRDAETFLIGKARQFNPQELTRLTRHLVLRLDPDRGEQLEKDEATRPAKQELTITHRADGSRGLRATLGPEDGELLETALSALSKPRPAADGTPDQRPAARRRAEALTELVRRALNADDLPTEGGEPVTVVVTTPIDYLQALAAGTRCPTCGHHTDGLLPATATLTDGTALTPETTRRLGCDSWLVTALTNRDGNVLDIGRATRTTPTPIRRALTIRDSGCAFPGCGRPPRWCHAHHIHHWANGGPTALNNLVLLCGHHHRLIHHSDWQVRLKPDGRPEFIPPPWIDPSQTPRPGWRPPDELHLS